MANARYRKMAQDVTSLVEKFLDKLCIIWNNIGITDDQQLARQNVVLLHIGNLLEEMVNEEELLKQRLFDNIDKYTVKLASLCQELRLSACETKQGLSVIDREKDLRSRYESLSKEKHDRLSMLDHLTKIDSDLSKKLGSLPYSLPSTIVPSQNHLNLLKARVDELKELKEKRESMFNKMKNNIMTLIDELQHFPQTSFERDVVCESSELFVLSDGNLKALKTFLETLEVNRKENGEMVKTLKSRLVDLSVELGIKTDAERDSLASQFVGCGSKTICALQEEVKRMQSLKIQKAKETIENAQKKLADMWEKCFYSKDQRDPFLHLCQCDYDIVSLRSIQQEIEKVELYYDENKAMLDKVYHHQQLFKEFVENERKARHPDRLYNRNCNLLKEEKARTKLTKEISTAEQDALYTVEQWEKQTDRLFLINGSRFRDHVKSQWQEYKAENADAQIRRLQKKVEQTENLQCSKAKTAAKRRFACMTPNKLAAKFLKLEDDGIRSAPSYQSYAFLKTNESPTTRHKRLDFGGFLTPRHDPVVMTNVRPIDREFPFLPLSSNKRINHGSLFALSDRPSQPILRPLIKTSAARTLIPKESKKPVAIQNVGLSSSGDDKPSTDVVVDIRVTSSKPPLPPCVEVKEDVDLVFSCTTVVSGILPLCDSDAKLDGSKTAASVGGGPSYQEFTRGLTESGKKNFSSSVVSLPKPVQTLYL